MYSNWASDEEVTRYLTWPTHKNIEITESLLSTWVKSYDNPAYYQWAIVPKSLNEPIGSIAVVHSDDSIKMAHVGYCIGKPWWGQGIMTESLNAVIHFLFNEVGMQRIECRHDTRNPASGAVMRKCGMQYEGILRRADRNNQGICDAAYYAILAPEEE